MRWMWTTGAVLALLASPAAAQRLVDHCEQQCFPQDPDVNGTEVIENGPVKVILYGHPDAFVSTIPLLSQLPDARVDREINQGYALPDVTTTTGTALDGMGMNGQSWFQFLPGKGRIEPRNGGERCWCWLPPDPFWLAPGPINLYGYLSGDAGLGAASTNAAVAGPLRMEAEWVEHTPAGDTMIAAGTSSSFTIQQVPGRSQLVEVLAPMRPASGMTAPCAGIALCLIRVSIRQVETGTVQATQREWRFRSGPDHPWRLVLPVQGAQDSTETKASIFGQNLTVAWRIAHAFGPDQIDPTTLDLRIHDGPRLHWAGPPTKVRNGGSHDDYGAPSVATWVVPRALLMGTTKSTALDLSAVTSQGTYRVTVSLAMPADPTGSAMNVPSPQMVGSILVAGLALLLVRRGH